MIQVWGARCTLLLTSMCYIYIKKTLAASPRNRTVTSLPFRTLITLFLRDSKGPNSIVVLSVVVVKVLAASESWCCDVVVVLMRLKSSSSGLRRSLTEAETKTTKKNLNCLTCCISRSCQCRDGTRQAIGVYMGGCVCVCVCKCVCKCVFVCNSYGPSTFENMLGFKCIAKKKL